MREELQILEKALSETGEPDSAQMIRCALGDSEEDPRSFLTFNDLWGGAGSIADQAGFDQGRPVRQPIEAALIKLGQREIQDGIVNERTGGPIPSAKAT